MKKLILWACTVLLSSVAVAQPYPSKPVRIIVNFPAGPQPGRLKGQMLDVRITDAFTNSLRAEVPVRETAA